MGKKTKKVRSYRVSPKPIHQKLPWPGLRAKDHLSRVITRFLKETREAKETEAWAQEQFARVLDHLPSEPAMVLLFREMRRRRRPIPEFGKLLLARARRPQNAEEAAGLS